MKIKLLFIFFLTQMGVASAQQDSAVVKKIDALLEQFYEVTYDNPDSALHILDTAEAFAKKNRYPQGITSVLRQRGMFYAERSEFVKSLGMLFVALKQDEQLKNEDGVAMDLLYIGLNYFNQEKLQEALGYFEKALKTYTAINDEAGMALVNANKGMVYRNMNRFEDALNCYLRVRAYYVQSGNDKNLSRVENNIGNVYKDLKAYDKALEHYQIAKDLKLKENEQFGLVIAYSNIADIYVEKGKFNESFDYYFKALQLAKEQKSVSLQKDVFFDLSYAYEKSGDFKKAYESFKRSTALRDSIVSEKYNTDIADMKVKYDSEKKENENAVLKKNNELQDVKLAEEKKQKRLFVLLFCIVLVSVILVLRLYRNKQKLNSELEFTNQKVKNQNATLRELNTDLIASEERLTAANATKDQLLSMLSHDLYNPVTSVINYTNELVTTHEKLSETELRNALKKVNAAVIPLQDLLDNILQWARIQKAIIQPLNETVNPKLVIDNIVKLYQPAAAFKEVSIIEKWNTDVVVKTDRLMLYFILRNILNNAVKFCKPQKQIIIEITKLEHELLICISDCGSGFDPALLKELNEPNQLNRTINAKGTGIGLSVSHQFVKLLGGRMEFNNTKEGAAVTLAIPL